MASSEQEIDYTGLVSRMKEKVNEFGDRYVFEELEKMVENSVENSTERDLLINEAALLTL